ncbi:unnamed protein product [Choristocarpus tenellus]
MQWEEVRNVRRTRVEHYPEATETVPTTPVPEHSLPSDRSFRAWGDTTATPTVSVEDQDAHTLPAFNFSFAVGGWLMFYNFGVAKCLQDHHLHSVHPRQKFLGSSAGSLAAAGLALGADFDAIMEMVKTSFIPKTHEAKLLGFLIYGIFFIKSFLTECLLKHLPMEKVQDLPKGKLTVVMSTMMTWESLRPNQFTSGRDLMDALLASCAAFPLALPHRWRGKLRLDGFFSEGGSAPFGLRTVYISPFYTSGANIRPSRYIPLWWFPIPPQDPNTVDWVYDLGYRDTLHWMSQEGIHHVCKHHQATQNLPKKGCNLRPPRSPHYYDAKDGRQPSLGCFIGNASSSNMVLDLIFVAAFHCLWKPLTALFIYLDVIVMATFSALQGALTELGAVFPSASALFIPVALDPVGATLYHCIPLLACMGLLVILKARQNGLRGTRHWRKVRGHLCTILNHRLLLRCLPWVGERVDPQSHLHGDFERSILYRVALHFI